MNSEFPKVKHKVIDGHLHFYGWKDENGVEFLHCFEEYRQNMGLAGINLCSLPAGTPWNVTSNLMCAVYKLLNENTFAHGGLVYDQYPMGKSMPEGMDFVTQLNELEEIGFDDRSEARKMIEKFVDEKPEAVATLLRNWLNEDWE